MPQPPHESGITGWEGVRPRVFARGMSRCDCQEADYVLTALFFVSVYTVAHRGSEQLQRGEKKGQ